MLRYMPLMFLSLAFLGGIILEDWLGWSWQVALLVSLCCLTLFLLRRWLSRRLGGRALPAWTQPALPYSLLLLAAAAGMLRLALDQPRFSPADLAWYNESGDWVLEGVVLGFPDQRDQFTYLRIQVERGRPQEQQLLRPLRGLVLVSAPPDVDWHYGDRLRIEGPLQTPPDFEEFSYRETLAHQHIYSLVPARNVLRLGAGAGNPVMAMIYALRARAWRLLLLQYPEPEASLLSGILLGIESGIPADVQAAFQHTGTSHIIAISGFNMTVLSGLFLGLFTLPLGRWRGLLVALLAIVFYTILVGAQAAVVRAAVMSSLALLGNSIGRRGSGMNALAFSAASMALAEPQVLWQIGFQLSVAATLGLVLYADPLQEGAQAWLAQRLPLEQARRIAAPLGEYFLFTLAAQLMVLPVIIYHFRRLSWVSILANPVVLPVQPLVMILAGVVLLAGLLVAPLGQWLSFLAWPFAAFTIRAVEFFDRLPGGEWLFGGVSLTFVLLLYLLLVGVPLAWPRLSPWLVEHRAAWLPSTSLLLLSALAVFTWRSALSAPDGRLHLTVLDCGGGDAVLIQSPTGRYILVDGGTSGRMLGDALGRRLPFYDPRLDWLVVAAPSEQQIAALPAVVERYLPRQVLWAGPPAGTRAARDLQRSLGGLQVPIYTAQAGQVLDLGAGARLQVLTVGRRGAVLWLEWGAFSALLPAGLDFQTLEQLQESALPAPVTAMLLADRGLAALNPPEWLHSLQPAVALLSVSSADRDGLPDQETIQALQDTMVLRTDRAGWVHLVTNGEDMWLEVERK